MLKSVIKDEIKVPAHIDYLGELRNFVTKTGKKYGFSESVVNAFKLSIDEAATNIIKHAYRDWEGDITMRIIVKKKSLTVILIDQGKYFDPSQVKNPDLKRYVDIGKKGGLGIFIMRKLIDEIDYRHTEEGNELRLTKYKDGDFRKTGADVLEPSAPSPLSLSLKSKYSLIAAAILTLIVMIGYTYYYIVNSRQIINDILTTEKLYSENVSRAVVEPEEQALSTLYIFNHIEEAINVSDYEEILKIIVLDTSKLYIFSTDSTDDELIFTEFKFPENYKEYSPGIYLYRTNNKKIEVYDVVNPIYAENNKKLGETHLLVKKRYIDKKVNSRRNEILRLAMLILLIGYLGIAVLIYLVMNPFRKLSNWIRDLDHGEVKDEIDFDTADELGEIAKAFSEITDKFRESQANLAEQERLQKEMQLAQDIQQTLLPTSVPVLEGYEIATFYEAAKEVGGDYYDFVEVDKDTLGIVVADVSGKGVPGSLIMTMIRTALRTEARGVKSASEVLARLNEFVVKDMKKGMFVTIFYVIIDSKKRRLNYASAGHNPMILYRKSTNKTYYLNPKGFPVGISLPDPELFKKSIESDTIQLAQDDVLLIYTDGITEAMNSKRHLFGEERLLEAIHKYSDLPVQPFVEKLKEEIHSFTEGYEQSDDITLVAIKEKSTPEKIELQRAQLAHNYILQGKNIREACEEAGITTYAYYNKYKKIFEEEGIEAYSLDETISVEAKHLSIEEKTKIYDIIKKHPEYGAKRISEELNTEHYGNTKINESRIYDELVRSRLNTRQLREAYVARAGKKKRMKPPGTPMLTLDGRIILDKSRQEYEEESFEPDIEETKKERTTEKTEKTQPEPREDKSKPIISKDLDDEFIIESLMTVPLEDLLDKNRETDSEVVVDNELFEDEHTEEKQEVDDLELVEENVSEEEAKIDQTLPDEEIEEEPSHDEEMIPIDEEEDSFVDFWEEGEVSEETSIEEEMEESFSNLFEEQETSVEDEPDLQVEEDTTEKKDSVNLEEDSSVKTDLNFEDEGIEHDFSFKDIWEDEEIKFDEEDDSDLEIVNEDEELEATSFVVDEEEDGNGTYHGDVMEHENIELIGEDLELEDDSVVEEDENQLSFNDLLGEIEHNISFLDAGMEINDESEQQFQDVASLAAENQGENSKLEQMLKNKNLILGLKYYREMKYDEAIEEFKKVVEIYPEMKEVHSILGNAYFRNDMNELAMEEYQRVKELDPYDVDAYENIGVIYANWGDYSRAISEWEKLLEIDPDRVDIRRNVEKAKNILQKVHDKV